VEDWKVVGSGVGPVCSLLAVHVAAAQESGGTGSRRCWSPGCSAAGRGRSAGDGERCRARAVAAQHAIAPVCWMLLILVPAGLSTAVGEECATANLRTRTASLPGQDVRKATGAGRRAVEHHLAYVEGGS
jgi:hypothetical protein